MATRPGITRLLPFLVLGACVILAYSNVYHNSFLYDDESLILHNRYIRDWGNILTLFKTTIIAGADGLCNYYRPLQTLAYLICYRLAGISLPAFHAVNILFHAVNACLMYLLGRRLGFAAAPVFAASLLWAVHPIHTEAITYMSGTADPLSVMFTLLTILIILPDFTRGKIFAATPIMLMALLSKESALCIPLLAMGCLYLRSPEPLNIKSYIKLWPLGVLAALYGVLHFILPIYGTYQPGAAAVAPAAKNNFVPFATLPSYVQFLLWPTGLHMERALPAYPTPWHAPVLLGMAMIGAGTALIIRLASEAQRALAWGILWFAGAHVILFSVDDIIYEHWMYLPSIGLFLGGAQAAYLTLKDKTPKSLHLPLWGCLGIVAALLGALTFQQNTKWRDAETFSTNIIDQGEPSAKARILLGNALLARHQLDEAAALYRTAIENSHDTLSAAHYNLATALLQMPNRAEHEADILVHLTRAYELEPSDYKTLTTMEQYYRLHDDKENAARFQHLTEEAKKHLAPSP